MRRTILQIAEAFARKRHRGQFRRDGKTPYISHVKQVAEFTRVRVQRMVQLRQLTSYEAEMAEVVAWLHDLIEDCGVTPEELREIGIPEDAIEATLALTKRFGELYLHAVARAKANRIGRPVKISDNLSNIGDNPTDKQIFKYSASLQFLLQDD